jgi:hypothetical protein
MKENTMSTATLEKIGIAGTVNGYGGLVVGDALVVSQDGQDVARRSVDGLGGFVAVARDLKLGWGQFPDDVEVFYLYDRVDGLFGYAIDHDWPDGSEWGYAPFAA